MKNFNLFLFSVLKFKYYVLYIVNKNSGCAGLALFDASACCESFGLL